MPESTRSEPVNSDPAGEQIKSGWAVINGGPCPCCGQAEGNMCRCAAVASLLAAKDAEVAGWLRTSQVQDERIDELRAERDRLAAEVERLQRELAAAHEESAKRGSEILDLQQENGTRWNRLRDTGGIPMTPEQKAALERVRNSATSWYAGMTLDYIKVADLCLCEHPADDDEPVTEEWLRSVGAIVIRETAAFGMLTLELGGLLCWRRHDRETFYLTDMRKLPHIKTRGDVRRLCRALGIPLNE